MLIYFEATNYEFSVYFRFHPLSWWKYFLNTLFSTHAPSSTRVFP